MADWSFNYIPYIDKNVLHMLKEEGSFLGPGSSI